MAGKAKVRLESHAVEGLKWLAVCLMVADHVGALLFARSIPALTLIGRLAFPLFGILLVHNHLHFTRAPWKQVGRLFLVALAAQPVYTTAFRLGYLNILFTLALGLAILTLWDRRRSGLLGIIEAIAFGAALFLLSIRVEYGPFGVLFLLSARAWIRSRRFAWAALSGALLILANGFSPLAAFGVLSFPIILYCERGLKVEIRRMPKLFFYLFYPVHILLLALLAAHLAG